MLEPNVVTSNATTTTRNNCDRIISCPPFGLPNSPRIERDEKALV
jgi:hypothetical protein